MEFYSGYKLRDIYKLSVNTIVKVGISTLYTIKVVIDEFGNVITAFPKK